jgi:hypothetical protein
MYHVIQNKFLFLIFFFVWTKYEKDNDGERKKNVLLKCIEMQDLHAIFFNSNIVLIIFVSRFWEKNQN